MSTQINEKASNTSTKQNAALQGAALAFAKPAVKPKPNSYNGANGALAAATKAGGKPYPASRSSPMPSPGYNGKDERLMSPYSRTSNAFEPAVPGSELVLHRPKANLTTKGEMSDQLSLPNAVSSRSISPSQIAASLAASRSAPITPNHTGQQSTLSPTKHKSANSPLRPPRRSASRSQDVPEDALDTTSIPPTNALIGMFERSAGNSPLTNRPKSTIVATKSDALGVKAPIPLRAQSALVKQDLGIPPNPSEPHPRRAYEAGKSRELSRVPKPPVQKNENDDGSSDDSFVSASEQRPPAVEPRKLRRTSVPPSADARAIEKLATAIVASSLASSRAASPSKSSLNLAPPVPPPRRGNNGLFPSANAFDSRTPSPAKGLRQTMRKPPKDEDEEDQIMIKKGKKNIMKKHPNKHHEGDRKRWRDAITERERKRYEAVWASNKGLYTTSGTTSFPPPPPGPETKSIISNAPNPSDSVSNIVVREVWSRSRLGPDVLSEVWDLVDRTGSGRLSKEEFVVGMWLIDQRLKGRKLPIRVGDSVWSSIASLGGIRVRGNGRKR